MTYAITLLCLAIVFGINLGSAILREFLSTEAEKSGGNSKGIYVLIFIIGAASSIIIAINNSVLAFVIRYISEFERHETYTKYNLSVSLKLTFSMFVNTAIIPLIVNLGRENWFGYGDLTVDIFFIIVSINFLTPTLLIFDVLHFWRRFLIYYEKWKGKDSKMTQREANELYEGTDPDTANLYATTMLTVFVTVFYTPLLPIAPLISLFGLIYKYWVEKVVMLRRNKIPQMFEQQMALTFSNLMAFC